MFGGQSMDIVAHHITICMGGNSKKKYPFEEGEVVEFTITHLGWLWGQDLKDKPDNVNDYTQLIMAAKVELPEGKFIKNKTPHITLLVNRAAGAKPAWSNKIEEWKPIEDDTVLSGVVQVCNKPEKPA